MNKFTIFTVILTASVVTVMADLGVRSYMSNEKASVLNTTVSPVIAPTEAPIPPAPAPTPAPAPVPAPVPSDAQLPITEPEIVSSPFATRITDDVINSAGFKGGITENHFDGKVFELLDISKNPVDAINFYELSDNQVPVASVTEIALRDEIRALQLYILLQNKTKPYIDLSLNETNAYGDRSFYINHAKKPEEAFLTVKIGKVIYAFAYVKTYHPQVKKLIQLLSQ